MSTPGYRIKKLRLEHQMSVAQLAEAIGVSEGYIRDIENEKTEPRLDVIVKIALVFGVSVNKLVTDLYDGNEE